MNRSFVDGGFNRNPNIHQQHLPKLAERGENMGWARFLIRAPTIHRLDATFAAQVNFGERMKTAALKLATWISETSDFNMTDLLDLAGEVRSKSTAKGEEAKNGARRLFQETTIGTSVSPMRRYGAFWHRKTLAEPWPSGRTEICEATVTSVQVDAEYCRTALTTLNISNNSEQNASMKERQAGVYLNDSCLVVLTRTIGVSALDGLLLGWDCYTWYGQESAPHFDRMWGVILHSSVLATDVVIGSLMQAEMARYRAAMKSLADLGCRLPAWPQPTSQPTSMAWAELQSSTARLAWLGADDSPRAVVGALP